MPHKHWCRDCRKDYDCREGECGDMLYTETCPTCELEGELRSHGAAAGLLQRLEDSSLPWWS